MVDTMTSLSSMGTMGTPRFLASTVLAPMVEPSERVAVVTGANQGLGFGIVKGLCERFDGYIYLTARDKKKGAEALKVLKDMKVCKHPDKLRFHELNILNEDQVDDFYHDLKNDHGGIDILINNAAIAYKRSSTVPMAEQVEKTILTNYLGVVRTCVFLFPLLRRHGRVVNLSSSAGHLSQVSKFDLKSRLMDDGLTERRLTDIMYEVMDMVKEHPKAHVDAGWPDSAYAISKIGVNLLTQIYQRKFDTEKADNDKVINAVHPGYVATNMSSYMGNVNIFEAAELPLYCALLPPKVAAPRGELVWNDFSFIDIDSATTPETSTDIYEYDMVEDIRHYAKYTTVDQYPHWSAELRRREEERKRNNQPSDHWSQELKRQEEERKSNETSDRSAQETPQSSKFALADFPSILGEESLHTNKSRVVREVQEYENWSAELRRQAERKRNANSSEHSKDTSQSDKAGRVVRSLKDTSTPSSLSYRTITRPTLPEEWISKLMSDDAWFRRMTTLPNC